MYGGYAQSNHEFKMGTEIPKLMLVLQLQEGIVLRAAINILLLLLLLLLLFVFSCHRPFLPGTSLEPTVIPTAQVSSFRLQYFPYYV
jgi:hypothetical protein